MSILSNREKKRQRGRNRYTQNHKKSILAVCAVIVLLFAVVSASSITLRAKDRSYQAQELELQEQIEEEKARAEEIENLDEYVGSDEYVEEVAKEKLGLVHENEIIFKAK